MAKKSEITYSKDDLETLITNLYNQYDKIKNTQESLTQAENNYTATLVDRTKQAYTGRAKSLTENVTESLQVLRDLIKQVEAVKDGASELDAELSKMHYQGGA